MVLKGVVRAERLPDPVVYIASLLRRCDPKHIVKTYDVPFDGLKGVSEQEDHDQALAFVDALARKSGRLRKGGDADKDKDQMPAVPGTLRFRRSKVPRTRTPAHPHARTLSPLLTR